MGNVAFLFPGQGSQKVGMGAEFFQSSPVARAIFDEADAILGWELRKLCFEGPEETLKQTENTQLAILTCSIAALRVLESSGVVPKVVAGHSLGEYSALVAAGVLRFSDALRSVIARAQLMAAAGKKRPGTMAAILGMEAEQVHRFCKASGGIVTIANYNCPGQLVVSGEIEAVNRVIELAKVEVGARRCRLLPVSGAFHSPLMESAQQNFQEVLSEVTLQPPRLSVVMNVTGGFATDEADIQTLLFKQITHPVQWEASVRTMATTGISHFVEVGPGKILCGLVNRTLPNSKSMNVEDVKSLEQTVESLKKAADTKIEV